MSTPTLTAILVFLCCLTSTTIQKVKAAEESSTKTVGGADAQQQNRSALQKNRGRKGLTDPRSANAEQKKEPGAKPSQLDSDSLLESLSRGPQVAMATGTPSTPAMSRTRDPFSPAPRAVAAAKKVEEDRRRAEERRRQEELERLQNPEFLPAELQRRMPTISLRGFLDAGDGAPLAILEVAGVGVLLVREGDTISVQNKEVNTVLRVKELSNLSVHVEIGTLGRVIVVR